MLFIKRFLFLPIMLLLACGGSPNGPSEINKLIQDAWKAFQNADYTTAEATFQEVLKRQPQNIEAQNGLGWTQAFARQYNAAIQTWQEGLLLDENNADMYAGLCLVNQVVNQFADCIDAGQKLLQLDSNYVFQYKEGIDISTIRGTMASAYFGLGDFANAAQFMDAADPKNAPHATDPKTLLLAIMTFLGLK